MRRLILMRHAKSAWGDPELADKDRPLNQRGRLAAALMGAWLRENGLIPDAALISDARRARETWAGVARELDAPVDARELPALYHADPDTLLEALRSAPADARTVLVIGHEPGLSAFLRRIVEGTPGAGARRAFDKFPTGAVAALTFAAPDWSGIDVRSARFDRFVVPKDLP